MEDPRDSLHFEIGWFKASAVGRFTIVSVLTVFVVLVGCVWVFGFGQLGTTVTDVAPQIAIGR